MKEYQETTLEQSFAVKMFWGQTW